MTRVHSSYAAFRIFLLLLRAILETVIAQPHSVGPQKDWIEIPIGIQKKRLIIKSNNNSGFCNLTSLLTPPDDPGGFPCPLAYIMLSPYLTLYLDFFDDSGRPEAHRVFKLINGVGPNCTHNHIKIAVDGLFAEYNSWLRIQCRPRNLSVAVLKSSGLSVSPVLNVLNKSDIFGHCSTALGSNLSATYTGWLFGAHQPPNPELVFGFNPDLSAGSDVTRHVYLTCVDPARSVATQYNRTTPDMCPYPKVDCRDYRFVVTSSTLRVSPLPKSTTSHVQPTEPSVVETETTLAITPTANANSLTVPIETQGQKEGTTNSSVAWVLPVSLSVGVVGTVLWVYAVWKVLHLWRHKRQLQEVAKRVEETRQKYRTRYQAEQHVRKINKIVLTEDVILTKLQNNCQIDCQYPNFFTELPFRQLEDEHRSGFMSSVELQDSTSQKETPSSLSSHESNYGYIDNVSTQSSVCGHGLSIAQSSPGPISVDEDIYSVCHEISLESDHCSNSGSITMATPHPPNSTASGVDLKGQVESPDSSKSVYVALTDVYSYPL